jgi:lambda repressor-like predicted transcriptional regulator
VSDEKSKPITTKEFLHERDMRIFKMRQAGTSVNEIARRFGISTQSVARSVQRQLEKMNKEAILAYPEILRMELERLDNLQQAIWPMTQHRRVSMDDGTEVQVEPDLKAIQQVLSIMDRRTKLLGMEQTNVNVNVDANINSTIRATIAGQPGVIMPASGFDAESEARKLLELMGIAGVLPAETVSSILAKNQKPDDGIIDAEVVSDLEDRPIYRDFDNNDPGQ